MICGARVLCLLRSASLSHIIQWWRMRELLSPLHPVDQPASMYLLHTPFLRRWISQSMQRRHTLTGNDAYMKTSLSSIRLSLQESIAHHILTHGRSKS